MALAEAGCVELPLAVAAWWVAIVLTRRDPMRATPLAIAAAGALAAAAAGAPSCSPTGRRTRTRSGACSTAPLPLLTTRRLDVLLQPRPGERVLEIGPGTGLQSLHVAPQLGADGELDHRRRPAADAGPRHGPRRPTVTRQHQPDLASAEALPFPDDHFDAAYLVTVLGEIPPARRPPWRSCGGCSSPADGWWSASSPTGII